MKKAWWDQYNEEIHLILDNAEQKKFNITKHNIEHNPDAIMDEQLANYAMQYVMSNTKLMDEAGPHIISPDGSPCLFGVQIHYDENNNHVEMIIRKMAQADSDGIIQQTMSQMLPDDMSPEEMEMALHSFLNALNQPFDEDDGYYDDYDDVPYTDPNPKGYFTIIYDNMNDIINEIKPNLKDEKSTLIKHKDQYYLIFTNEMKRKIKKKFRYVTEIGRSEITTQLRYSYLMEHGTVIIKNNATDTLLKLKK